MMSLFLLLQAVNEKEKTGFKIVSRVLIDFVSDPIHKDRGTG